MTTSRQVFFLSDGTGITAETLGGTLLTQFEGVEFKKSTLPFITSPDKARSTVNYINHIAGTSPTKPLVFSTTVNDEVRAILRECNAFFLDLFDTFITSIEQELGVKATHTQGRAHGVGDQGKYNARIAAMNYAMEHDDGQSVRDLGKADIILVAPSRCGKTPTSLYLALTHGIFATNFPLLEEDLEAQKLPTSLRGCETKLYGLTSDAERLSAVRAERRPGSKYSSLAQCAYELRQVEQLYNRYNIPFINSSTKSVEEIAALIMQDMRLRKESN